jgi:hypothetical protein
MINLQQAEDFGVSISNEPQPGHSSSGWSYCKSNEGFLSEPSHRLSRNTVGEVQSSSGEQLGYGTLPNKRFIVLSPTLSFRAFNFINNIRESQHIMTTGNRAVMALDAPHIGHVVRETDDKIVVFGGVNFLYSLTY